MATGPNAWRDYLNSDDTPERVHLMAERGVLSTAEVEEAISEIDTVGRILTAKEADACDAEAELEDGWFMDAIAHGVSAFS